MKSKYQNYKSFYGKTRIILSLLGILPFLVVVFIFDSNKIPITNMIVLFSAVILFCILAGFSLLRSSADNLVLLTNKIDAVKKQKKKEPIKIKADKELNNIAENFNILLMDVNQSNRELKEQGMQLLLYARDLSNSYYKIKQQEKIKKMMGRYVGKELMEKLIASNGTVIPANKRMGGMTILFADIRSFTYISEKMSAEAVIEMLNEFFDPMMDIITKYNGVLDKFIGDELMAVFGIIPSETGSYINAINAAIEMQETVKRIMESRAAENKQTFKIGIGINTGKVILGNVGSKHKIDYTVIGACVNIAAKFEQVAKEGEIIIGEKTYNLSHEQFLMGEKNQIQIKHRSEPIIYYQVLGKN